MNIFFGVTTNLQASQHTDQGVIMGKERVINEGSDSREKILGSNKEGYLMATSLRNLILKVYVIIFSTVMK